MRRMGSRNPERDRPTLSSSKPVRELVERSPGWTLLAVCKRDPMHTEHISPLEVVARYGGGRSGNFRAA